MMMKKENDIVHDNGYLLNIYGKLSYMFWPKWSNIRQHIY
jgi:hypothetical protein